MSFKVWRRKSDNTVVGYCEPTYSGFEPGGDLTTYTTSIESLAPTLPPDPPTPAKIRLNAVLSDPTVPGTLKALLAELVR